VSISGRHQSNRNSVDCIAESGKQTHESSVIIHEPASSKEMANDRTY
jgi:hypothetical protein